MLFAKKESLSKPPRLLLGNEHSRDKYGDQMLYKPSPVAIRATHAN